jgi:hypothetical protein
MLAMGLKGKLIYQIQLKPYKFAQEFKQIRKLETQDLPP